MAVFLLVYFGLLVLVVGPHLWWNLAHPVELFAQMHKLQIDPSCGLGTALRESFSSLAQALVGFLPLLLATYWFVFGNVFRARALSAATPLSTRWMGRGPGFSVFREFGAAVSGGALPECSGCKHAAGTHPDAAGEDAPVAPDQLRG